MPDDALSAIESAIHYREHDYHPYAGGDEGADERLLMAKALREVEAEIVRLVEELAGMLAEPTAAVSPDGPQS